MHTQVSWRRRRKFHLFLTLRFRFVEFKLGWRCNAHCVCRKEVLAAPFASVSLDFFCSPNLIYILCATGNVSLTSRRTSRHRVRVQCTNLRKHLILSSWYFKQWTQSIDRRTMWSRTNHSSKCTQSANIWAKWLIQIDSNIQLPTLEFIVNRRYLNLYSEFSLLNSVVQWAQHECKRRGLTVNDWNSVRNILNER